MTHLFIMMHLQCLYSLIHLHLSGIDLGQVHALLAANIFSNIMSGVAHGLSQLWNGVTTVASKVINGATQLFSDVVSTLLSPIVKLLISLFWNSKIGLWLVNHSIAGTIFVLENGKNGLNSSKYLENIIDKNPLELIFSGNHVAIFNYIDSNITTIFLVISIFILLAGIIFACQRAMISTVLDNNLWRTELFQTSFNVIFVVVFLSLLPYIIDLFLQLDGVILLSFQKLMMGIHLNGLNHMSTLFGKNIIKSFFDNKTPTLWQVACEMGADSQTINACLSKGAGTGFIFNFMFLLISLGTAIWVKFYYFWREISFTILYALGYLQIPMIVFHTQRWHFTRWCTAMFGVIFIQAINGLVVTLMSLFWMACLYDLNSSNTSIAGSFGIMITMVMILLVFQPVSNVIAHQLGIDTKMTDNLRESSSSSLKGVAAVITGAIVGGVAGGISGIKGISKLTAGSLGALKAKREALAAAKDADNRTNRLHPKMPRSYYTNSNLAKSGLHDLNRGARALAGTVGKNAANLIEMGAGLKPKDKDEDYLKNLGKTEAGGIIDDNLKAAKGLTKKALHRLGLNTLADHINADRGLFNKNNKADKNNSDIDAAALNKENINDHLGEDVHGKDATAKKQSAINSNHTDENSRVASSVLRSRAHSAVNPAWERSKAQAVIDSMNDALASEGAITDPNQSDYNNDNVSPNSVSAKFRNNLRKHGFTNDEAEKISGTVMSGLTDHNGYAANAGTSANGIDPKPDQSINNLDDVGNSNTAMADINETPIARNGLIARNFNNGNTTPVTTMSPQELNDNILRNADGTVAPDAIQAHVSNNGSYITAAMNDGSFKNISSSDLGDVSLDDHQEIVQPLSLDNGVLQPATSDGHVQAATLYQNKQAVSAVGRIPAINSLLADYNANNGVATGYHNDAIPVANNLVDLGGYTGEHLANDNNFTKFALNADHDASYVVGWDDSANKWKRISPKMSGIDNLSGGTNVEVPLNLNDATMQFADDDSLHGANITNDLNDSSVNKTVASWLKNIKLNNYVHPTAFNKTNYMKNHYGNQNINTISFSTDE